MTSAVRRSTISGAGSMPLGRMPKIAVTTPIGDVHRGQVPIVAAADILTVLSGT